MLCTVLVVNVPQAEAAVDGMVRVWLKSMDYYGSISSTSITLNGSYSVPANPDVVLSTRGEYTIEVVGGTLMLSGTGEVMTPDGGVIAIGSGGNYALAAARALVDCTDMTAHDIAEKALNIAADICVFTNHNIVVEDV